MKTEASNVNETNQAPVTNKKDTITTVLIFVISVACAGIGFLMLFVPEINAIALCDIFCGILVCIGIVLIGKFFAIKAFRKFHDYSFALGVLLVVLGCIGFIRVENLAAGLDMWTGFIVLCIGIFMLQCSIQLKLLECVMWLVDIVLTALIMIAAILTLIYWQLLMEALPEFPYWSILAAGIINVINFPIVLVSMKSAIKRREAQEPAAQDDTGTQNGIATQNGTAADIIKGDYTTGESASTVSDLFNSDSSDGYCGSNTSDNIVAAVEDDLDNTAPLPDLSDML